MRAHHRRIVGAASSLLLLVSALAAPSATFANTIVHQADLTGAAEVPGPGDADASGFAEINVDPANGIVCWTIIVEDMDAATAAHVHVGGDGVAGGVVVALGTPDGEGFTSDCSSGHDSGDLQSIADDPTGHYVNVHNAAFPAGAVRGQLSAAIELSDVSVFVLACPEGIDSPDDLTLDEAFETCSPVMRQGDLDTLPDGYAWTNDPIETALELELTEPDGITRSLDDAGQAPGDGGCNVVELTCFAVRGYLWEPVLAGATSVSQSTFPDGYAFGWAILSSAGVGGIPPTLIESAVSSVTFDTTGIDSGAQIVLVNVVAATASPSPSGSQAPAGTQAPVVTPPPTSTIDGVAPSGSIAPALAAIALIGLMAASLAYRRRLNR